MLVHRFEPLPAALDLRLDRFETICLLRAAQVPGLSHQLEPGRDRDSPSDRLGVVRDRRMPALDLVQWEEAGVDCRLDDVDPGAVLGAPVQRTGDQHLPVGHPLVVCVPLGLGRLRDEIVGEALDEASQVSQGPPARPARRVPRLLVLDWWVGAAVLLLAVGAIWSYKPSGGGDAEGSAVSPVPSVPLCAQRLGNGQILRRTAVSSDQGHTLEIRKGSGGDAIVKLKDSATGRTVLSFFVGDAATASEDRIPDGSYEVQFAFGKYVDQTCTNFVGDHRASQFPGEERLVTQDTETERITDHLIYTLYAVASGNVNAKSIDPSVFDAD